MIAQRPLQNGVVVSKGCIYACSMWGDLGVGLTQVLCWQQMYDAQRRSSPSQDPNNPRFMQRNSSFERCALTARPPK